MVYNCLELHNDLVKCLKVYIDSDKESAKLEEKFLTIMKDIQPDNFELPESDLDADKLPVDISNLQHSKKLIKNFKETAMQSTKVYHESKLHLQNVTTSSTHVQNHLQSLSRRFSIAITRKNYFNFLSNYK